MLIYHNQNRLGFIERRIIDDNEGTMDAELIKLCMNQFRVWAEGDRIKYFSQSYFLENLTASKRGKYESRIRKSAGYWVHLLIECKIDPNAFSTIKFPKEQNRQKLIESLRDLEKKLGVENLNDSSMNKPNIYIELPRPLRKYEGNYSTSNRYRIKPLISLAAFQRRCFNQFGSWDAALEAAGIDVSKVKRKVASHSVYDLLTWFDRFVSKREGKWTVSTIRDYDHALFRAIGNNGKKTNDNIFPFNNISDEYIFNMWVFWRFWKETGTAEYSENWWLKNSNTLRQEYELNHRAQERWSLDKIQNKVLERYSNGCDLNRASLESTIDGKTLLAAMRSPRFAAGQGEVGVIKKVGILTENLTKLRNIIDDVSLDEVSAQLRKLVANSLGQNKNLLSRESMVKENTELFYASMRWFNRFNKHYKNQNDWSKTLEFFGLNPNVFELGSSKRGKRGAVFQRFFESMLSDHFEFVSHPSKIDTNNQVCCNKSYSSRYCSHNITCKPDFVFKDLIIDTKIGGSLAKKEQLERYLDHKNKVLVVTINDRSKMIRSRKGVIKIISFKEFVRTSNDLVGVKVGGHYVDELAEVLRQASLFAPEG